MSENLYKLFDENNIIYNDIIKLMCFFNDVFNECNNKIVIRSRKLDFYDLFFYMLNYNSSINETHASSNYNFNANYNKNISENAFINRLVKFDYNHIKEINHKFIDFYYKLFKIDINNIVTATDGSNIKLLSSLNKHFKLNKNNHYTNATISCVYDVNNNLPLFMNINKSFNEVDNLLKQLNNDIIKKYKYKIINVTDRGYDDIKLIKYYLQNDILFVSRITKKNSFITKLENNNNTTFTINLDDNIYKLRIVKYTNLKKPDVQETKNELTQKINELNLKINLTKNNRIEEKSNYDNLCVENKSNNIELKNIKLKKINKKNIKNIKNIKNKINKVRILKSISKKKIIKLEKEIDNLNKDKNKFKFKLNQLETYEHSDFYIVTNNLKYSFDELKEIYKKRWCVETSFKFEKTVLNLNQMNNKNIQLIKQNIYIMQFICIMNAFINKLLEKIIKKNYYLNKTLIFKSLHDDIFILLKKILINKKCTFIKNKNKKKEINKKFIINKEIKKMVNELLETLKLLSKYQIKNKKDRNYTRIKKRINNNKFNNRNAISNG